jgi:hypothetical protein
LCSRPMPLPMLPPTPSATNDKMLPAKQDKTLEPDLQYKLRAFFETTGISTDLLGWSGNLASRLLRPRQWSLGPS